MTVARFALSSSSLPLEERARERFNFARSGESRPWTWTSILRNSAIAKGQRYISDIPFQEVAKLLNAQQTHPSTNFSGIKEAEAVKDPIKI